MIYPRREAFQQALLPFDFGGGLRLWVLPFDMDAERLLDADLLSLVTVQALSHV